jgi:isochorismate synthase/ubiquinone/menaquinone biosynthesis methyltransferase
VSKPTTALPRGEEKTSVVRAMFDRIAPRYELLNRIIAFGLDQIWRRRTIRSLGLSPSSFVVDLACGTGDLIRLAERERYRVVGVDFALNMLRSTHDITSPLIEADAARLPLADGSVDGVVSGFALRNFSDLDGALREIARILRPLGRVALLEVDEPDNPLLRLGHRLWFRYFVPTVGGALSDVEAYRYLPRSFAYLPPPPALRQLLEDVGFEDVERFRLHGGIAQLICATRAGGQPFPISSRRKATGRSERPGIVQVVGGDGRAVAAASLSARRLAVSATDRARIRRLAQATGVIVEAGAQARYGVGTAARLLVPTGLSEPTRALAVVERLAEVATDDGAAPVAFAALAYWPAEPAEFVVPSVTLVVDQDDESVILVGRDGADLDQVLEEAEASAPQGAAPVSFSVSYPEGRADYLRRVEQAIAAIVAGSFEKVVLARNCRIRADAPYRQDSLVAAMRATQPNTTLFAVDGFLGASPELLIERRRARLASTPLAGTAPKAGDSRVDSATVASLFSSEKERFEHRVVVEEIEKVLTAWGASLEAALPEPLELATVTHLATRITGTLDETAGTHLPSALELALALHPTPAIGGSPRDAALSYLAGTEPFDRGKYGGPVGYLDANGDGAFWIGIRSATVRGNEAVLCAGGGIVAGSEPQAEFAETEAKFAAMLEVLTAT